MIDIRVAVTDRDLESCFPVMRLLRPHLDRAEFLRRVRVQEAEGYQLVWLSERGRISAVAGFRLMHNLFNGRVLYVDDLVTDEGRRSRGHGKALLAWLVDHARSEGCATLELDSGVQRAEAHRFYFRERMTISSYHFRLALD